MSHKVRYMAAAITLLAASVIGVAFAAIAYAQEQAAGGTLAELPDGTLVTRQEDDTVVIRLSNKLVVTLSPNGMIAIAGAGQPVEVSRTSLQKTEMSDGTTIIPWPDGSVRVDLPDGSAISVSPDNTVAVTLVHDAPVTLTATDEAALCTFTAARAINLRAGPGTRYEIVGVLRGGESADVIGQETGRDGYIWWRVGSAWVRSDLGESDCAPVCGNQVCESGEDAARCAQDCPLPTPGATATPAAAVTATTAASSSSACLASDCDACYRTISCYPDCNQCTCSKNSFGCPTCYCRYPASSQTRTTTSASSASRACDFASCEACIAAFPCSPGPCGTTQCSLNEFGCPECTTAP